MAFEHDDRHQIVIVGGGVAGLTAAHTLLAGGADEVVLLEASDRLGGQVRTVDVAGSRVDVGSEAIHLGHPGAAALVRELGLDETVVGSAPGTSLLLTKHGLRPLPAGVGPTGPTKVWPVLASRTLSTRGLLRAAMEPLHARRKYPDDIAVGQFVAMRFGPEVAEVFVDPLLGNLHSGEVRALSLQATAPQLRGIAGEGTSLLWRAIKGPPPRPPAPGRPLPMFASWPGGLSALVDALQRSVLAHGGRIELGHHVVSLRADSSGWVIGLADGSEISAEQVVVATGGPGMADLLQPVAPTTAAALRWVRHASVATVVLGYERADGEANQALRDYNGLLLTSKQAKTVKAATNLTRKWPMVADSAYHLVRVSVGRITSSIADDLTDAELIERAAGEFGDLIGLTASPVVSAAYRWPTSMPQLGVGHVQRMSGAADELRERPGLHIAGCTVDGLGLTSTISSGRRVAAEVERSLTPEGRPA